MPVSLVVIDPKLTKRMEFIINIGGGKKKSILEIAELIGGHRVFIEPRLEPKQTLADNRKAKELLGWEPKLPLEEGIAELKVMYGLV